MGGEYFVFDERFAEAFLHEGRPARVMGRRLRPFSYWHKVQLEYVQSKVLLGGAGLWDAWVAAKICSTEYPQNASFRKSYSNLWMLCWHARYGWRSVKRELDKLSAHIADFASPPKLWSGKGSSKERLAEALDEMGRLTGDASFLQRAAAWRNDAALEKGKQRDIDDSIEQVALYMKQAGRSAEEAWNMPMGALLWLNACFLKMEGSEVAIWTPMDEQVFEAHKKTRYQNIAKIADELQAETPILSRDMAFAQASVQYWEKVVEAQKA